MPFFSNVTAKWGYVTRRLDKGEYQWVPERARPEAGTFVVARVESVRRHQHLENAHGRRCRIFPGDLIVGAYGSRYATDAFEGYVPDGPRTHLLTAGGVVGTVHSAHDSLSEPTELEVLGRLATPAGDALSTDSCAMPQMDNEHPAVPTVVVIGSSMNAGKTTTVACLVRGLSRAGLRPGAGKVTGSGSGKDRWSYLDSGATEVLDFLDFGMPSTFRQPLPRLVATMESIRNGLAAACDVVVLEIADGVLQEDTAGLMSAIRGIANAVVVAAGDSLAAKATVELASAASLPVVAVSGVVARSPLARREAATATHLPVLTCEDLAGPGALALVGTDSNKR